MKNDVVIIGAGPAGFSAALQMKRYHIEPVLLEKDQLGGLLKNANLVENYPGFPDGITGIELIALFEQQMKQYQISATYDEVTSLDYEDNLFFIQGRNHTYEAKYVVVATGTKAKPYPIEIPIEAMSRVFSEVWPLRNIYDGQIAIIGAGDAAFDYALSLVSRRNKVFIINRGSTTSCLPLLHERANNLPAITYLKETTLQGVALDPSTNQLQLITNGPSLMVDYLLFAIGREPAIDFLTERVKLQGRKMVEDGRLNFIGDVCNGLYRQVAIAAGDGLRVAMKIHAKARNDS